MPTTGEVVNTLFGVVGYLIRRKKPHISVEPGPTLQQLEAALDDLRPSPSYRVGAPAEIPFKFSPTSPPEIIESTEAKEDVGTACVPCSLSHLAACAGELSEVMRFAREDLASPEVSLRIDHCLSELAAAERIDLAPERLVSLAEDEKQVATDALREMRDIRHKLEWFESVNDLEQVAAQASNLQHKVGRAWLKIRMERLTPEQKQEVAVRAKELMQKQLEPAATEI